MKIIIAGTRTIHPGTTYIAQILSHFGLIHNNVELEIVSGHAAGVDRCGEKYAKESKIKLTIFPADWDRYQKAAGYIRNKEMANYSDALVLIWNGESNGSASMKHEMLKLNKPVYEVILRKH